MMESQKVEAIATKQFNAKGEISLSNNEEDKTDIKDDISLNQANNKYPLLLQL